MKKKVVVLILLSFVGVSCQTSRPLELSVFRSDGCSGFPDGTISEVDLWKEDCYVHDRAYWVGGTRKERKSADQKLRDGLRGKGKPIIAEVVYAGVRIGGTPLLPTPWRWGFGWGDYGRGYRVVGEEEREMVERAQ